MAFVAFRNYDWTRAERVIRLRWAGKTFVEIGKKEGVTGGRAGEIYRNALERIRRSTLPFGDVPPSVRRDLLRLGVKTWSGVRRRLKTIEKRCNGKTVKFIIEYLAENPRAK